MKQYLDLLYDVYQNGIRQTNRTGIDTVMLPGAMLKFDLREGFPAVTTKHLAFDQVKGELIGFLRGCDSAAQFRELGCRVWDANANLNKDWLANPHRRGQDDLGRVYGVNWRGWRHCEPYHSRARQVDQIKRALHDLRHNPTSRRIIVTAWNPAELDQMALPPCHLLFQLIVEQPTKTLHMVMYQRSCDMFLGVPFNIASYALLLELFAGWAGYIPGTLSMMLADVHIYTNHFDQVIEQLHRPPMPLPQLHIRWPYNCENLPLETLLENLRPDDVWLENYESHPPIKAPMAV